MRWKEQLLTLTPYQPGKSIDAVKKQFKLEKIVKLASNENPFGCSPAVVEALQTNLSGLAIYPDGYATHLREKLSEFLNVDEEELILGNGSDNLIQIISRSLLHPNASTIMATPSFSQYKHNAVIEGAVVKELPLINGEHDLEAMLAAIDEQTNVIWVCSPNNPTGTYIPENKLIPFLDKVPPHILVVLDEAYFEYVVAEDYYDSIRLTRKYENLIVLRTFSKIYGMAALRVGYGVANRAIIKVLEPVREPFNVNSLGQLGAIAAINDQEFVEVCKEKNRQGLSQFYDFCEQNQLDYYPSQTNFILIDLKVDGDVAFQFLQEKGYIVRSGKALGFPTAVRITVGSSEQNEGVLQALSEFLDKN
ncbi:histidinol-phosphate transaminase [Neobacillus vireti]|uniref:Histidinol-phosphate aminotransferase n=1 Tax=Neobacillus vireti LMG 21834 TaxID=1131730 RepID=A0AB94IH93_9BACI|nr:histidinol-phosphate transaminase [Neobacillus vireti]ETI66486.1 histidinol-phosphate aminotransferase [Neobacillus vireti LMG 21834]KLT17170.1 histidinol-phosphate aminotransferase [Neobacillus vireti]